MGGWLGPVGRLGGEKGEAGEAGCNLGASDEWAGPASADLQAREASGSGNCKSQGGWVGRWGMWDERMGWEDRLGTGQGDGWGGLLGLGRIR